MPVPAQPSGERDTLLCFAEIESHGAARSNPQDPELLSRALEGKALLNFQIQLWADGVADAAHVALEAAMASVDELRTPFSRKRSAAQQSARQIG
jgi:hypothetical protein